MLTTPALINFLQQREGFRKHAYDDKHPHRTLTADTVIEGKLTIGYGTTRYPDGTHVKWNDTVSQQEALDYLQAYVRAEIEPTLENLIHTPLKGCQYDALGSVLYQFGAEEVSDWRLIRRINKCEDWEKVALEWVDGTVMWMGEPRFWARRICELFMYFDLNWRAGANVPVGSSVIEALEIMGVSEAPALALPTPTPALEPVLILDKPLPMEAKVPRQMTLPDEWDKMTEKQQVAFLNTGEFVRIGGTVGEPIKPSPLPEAAKAKIAVKTAKSPRPVEHVEYLDDNAKAEIKTKPIRNTQRGKGYGKQEVAKALAVTSVGGLVADNIGAIEPAIKFANQYSAAKIGIVFGIMTLFAIVYYFYGQWQEQKGRDEADTLIE